MLRAIVLGAIALTLPVGATASSTVSATGDDPPYARANARLARLVPHYPGARLVRSEAVGGEVGEVPFEALQRYYKLRASTAQGTVNRFYRDQLGAAWQRRREACLVSRSRLVITLVSLDGRRLGVLMDARGAGRCYGLTGILGDLLEVDFPG